MGKVRARKETNRLYLDFHYQGVRCREYTALSNTQANRRRAERLLRTIEAEITLGTFDYAEHFPHSRRARRFAASGKKAENDTRSGPTASDTTDPLMPTFAAFTEEWLMQYEVTWKPSYQDKVKDILVKHLLPRFGKHLLTDFTKAAILNYRSELARTARHRGKPLSHSRINQIISLLRQILGEAATRYEITNPAAGIKALRQPRTEIDPFSLDEVQQFLDTVDAGYREYFVIRFFTGLRTSEIDGLRWHSVDFEQGCIHVKETLVKGKHSASTKTASSERVIAMSTQVRAALLAQHGRTGGSREAFVFQSANGGPVLYRNISNRVWYPTLIKAGLRRRRPYQTRHTAATLWLAAGESPEWIARQMGHSNTRMLFTVYSRFVPNLTHRDGSAMERLLRSRFQAPETDGIRIEETSRD